MRWFWKADTRRTGSAILAMLVGLSLFLPLLMVSYTELDPRGAVSPGMVVMSLTKPSARPPRLIPAKPTFEQKFAAANPETGLTTGEQSAKKSVTLSTCDLLPQIALAVQNNLAASQAIADMPPELRSLSDAIMLWNGQWAHLSDSNLPSPIIPIRSIIIQVVLTSPTSCQSAEVTGPLFMAIRDRDKTTMLVIGSGVWHWTDLAKIDPPDPGLQPSQMPQ